MTTEMYRVPNVGTSDTRLAPLWPRLWLMHGVGREEGGPSSHTGPAPPPGPFRSCPHPLSLRGDLSSLAPFHLFFLSARASFSNLGTVANRKLSFSQVLFCSHVIGQSKSYALAEYRCGEHWGASSAVSLLFQGMAIVWPQLLLARRRWTGLVLWTSEGTNLFHIGPSRRPREGSLI